MIYTLISASFEPNRIGEAQLFQQAKRLPVFDQTRDALSCRYGAPSPPYFELLDFRPHLKTLLR